MTGDTGITKIDIFTVTGLTLSDGSILDIGGVIKMETIFPIGINGFITQFRPYRSLEIYKTGYDPNKLMGIEDEKTFDMGDDFQYITMLKVYELVAEYINDYYGAIVCEVVVYEEPII